MFFIKSAGLRQHLQCLSELMPHSILLHESLHIHAQSHYSSLVSGELWPLRDYIYKRWLIFKLGLPY